MSGAAKRRIRPIISSSEDEENLPAAAVAKSQEVVKSPQKLTEVNGGGADQSDDEVPLKQKEKQPEGKQKQKVLKKRKQKQSSSEDEQPLSSKKSAAKESTKKPLKKKSKVVEIDDEVVVSKANKKGKSKVPAVPIKSPVQTNKSLVVDSDDDDDVLMKSPVESQKSSGSFRLHLDSADETLGQSQESIKPYKQEQSPLVGRKKKESEADSSSDTSINESEDEKPSGKGKMKETKMETLSEPVDNKKKSDDDTSDTSINDSDDEKPKKKGKSKDNKSEKSSGKTKEEKSKASPNEARLVRLRRFIQTAGIRCFYAKLYKGAQSEKEKIRKLEEYLESKGLPVKGLTLEICKKFRLKDEQKKELAALDTGAIISHKRSRLTRGSIPTVKQPEISWDSDQSGGHKATFSRLKGIVDSEEDSD